MARSRECQPSHNGGLLELGLSAPIRINFPSAAVQLTETVPFGSAYEPTPAVRSRPTEQLSQITKLAPFSLLIRAVRLTRGAYKLYPFYTY